MMPCTLKLGKDALPVHIRYIVTINNIVNETINTPTTDSVFREDLDRDDIKDISIDCFGSKLMIYAGSHTQLTGKIAFVVFVLFVAEKAKKSRSVLSSGFC